MGIEPTSEAWEALDKTLEAIDLAALSVPSDGLNWKLDGNRNGYHAQISIGSLCLQASGFSAAAPILRESLANFGWLIRRFLVWIDGRSTDSYHLVCIV
jgi:hypothetical protein